METYIHPACAAIPEMSESEFDGLCHDIAVNGLRQAIILWRDGEGREWLLDGRHRERACEVVGIQPRYEYYSGTQPAHYVMSANMRRNLSSSQKAMIAASLMPYLEEEKAAAKARQGTRTDLGQLVDGGGARSDERVALAMGTNRGYLSMARKLKEVAPAMADAVASGGISLHAAMFTIEHPDSVERGYIFSCSEAAAIAKLVSELRLRGWAGGEAAAIAWAVNETLARMLAE